MPNLKVTFSGGKREVNCSGIAEGDSGLFLQNSNGETIGYIPYTKLNYVKEEGSTDQR